MSLHFILQDFAALNCDILPLMTRFLCILRIFMYFLKIVFVAKFAMFCVNHVVGAFDFILTYRQR